MTLKSSIRNNRGQHSPLRTVYYTPGHLRTEATPVSWHLKVADLAYGPTSALTVGSCWRTTIY